MRRLGAALLGAAALLAAAPAAARAPAIGYRVVASFPHDPRAFTQGLLWWRGRLLEGTGLRGRSELREVELASGRVLRRRALDRQLFGEGIALAGERLVQLTWRAGRALIYEPRELRPLGEHRYDGEGWGLTFDGRELLMSDGSAVIQRRDPRSFAVLGRFEVRDGARPVTRLNELEYVAGAVYANVWLSSRIVRFDPSDGRVTGWLDLAELRPPGAGRDDVLNGIAWDAQRSWLLVTGKRWPRLYALEIRGHP